jgi:hypothetical protein
VPGVAAGPACKFPPTEFGFVVNPLDVEVPVVPPLDCRLPPIEFGFVVNPLDVEVVGVPAGVTMSVPDDPVVVVVVVLGVVVVVVGLGVVVVTGVDPTKPVVGRVGVGEIAVGGSAGVVGVVGVTGGITAMGGAVRGGTMSVLRTQSGPLRSMQAGTASGTLRLRSVDCASADAELANSTSSDAEVSFI